MSLTSELTPSFISPEIAIENLQLAKPLSLGVMASGSGSNFEALMSSIDNGDLNAQVKVLIYNNPDAKIKERSDRWGVPTALLNHREFKSRELLDTEIVKTLQEYGVEWVIMAGWMRIVTPILIDAFPQKVLNIHPSLLPSFRGIKAVEKALEFGLKVTGCTVHYASAEVDSGPIIAQAVVPILPDDTAETLHARIQVQEHRLFPMAIALAAFQAEKRLD